MSAMLQGYACSECAPSFYRDDDRTCQECDNYIWVLYILAFLAALTLAPLLLRVSKSQGFMSINIFVATMQVRAVACCRLTRAVSVLDKEQS
jgi:hypothetical protein